MSAYKDPSGTWRYRCTVTLKNGMTERISGTPSAANTKLAAKEAEAAHRERTVNPPVLVAAKPAAPGFSTFAARWLAAYPASVENRTSTITEKEFHVRIHLAPYWGETPIDRIDSMAVAQMIGDLKQKKKLVRAHFLQDSGHRSSKGYEKKAGRPSNKDLAIDGLKPMRETEKTLSPKTVRNVTQTLHRILTSAHEWKVISEVPKFPKRKTVTSPWDWYTAEDSALLTVAAAAAKDVTATAILLFAIKTGARQGEQLAVTWGDIDWKGKKVHFRRQYHKGEFRELKAGPARAVDLSDVLITALKAHRAKQVRPLGLGAETASRDLVFPQDHEGGPMEFWHFRGILKKYARRAGIRLIKWHELRHSFASQLVSGGVPLKQVQEWLGHSTIHMTMRYSHLAPTGGAVHIAVLDRVTEGASS